MTFNIMALVISYRGEPTLCLVGDNLPRQTWLWKLYNFLVKFASPVSTLSENDNTDLTENLQFIVHEMLWEINQELEKHRLQLKTIAGNLYLSRL